MPITFENADLGTNESLKGFETPDALATSYLELKTKVDGGSIDLLPEEMRKDPAVSVFKTVPDLVKGYVETKKMVGGIEKAPAKADEYKFTQPANLHPNFKAEGIQNAFKGIFHEAGLGNKSADMVQQKVLGVLSQGMANQEKAKQDLAAKNETALRSEWGSDYDKKFDMVVKTLSRAGGIQDADIENVAKAMKGSPTFLKAMGSIVGLLSEDSIGKLGEAGEKQITEKTEAQTKIQDLLKEISADSKHPYHDAKNPKRDEFMKEWNRLHELAYS